MNTAAQTFYNPAMNNMGMMGGYNPGMMAVGNGFVGNLGGPIANQYMAPQKPPAMSQPLNQENIAMLQNLGGSFSAKVSQTDILRSVCTHKNNGQIVAFQNPDGKMVCPICGESWNPVEYSEEEINAKVEDIIDALQMAKVYAIDTPTKVIEEFFPIIPLMRKIGKFTTIASNEFARFEPALGMQQQQNAMSGFGMLGQLTGGYNMGMMGEYNPAMGGYNPGVSQGQPINGMMMQPGGVAQNQQMMYNPNMMQGQPMPGYNVPQGNMVSPMAMAGGMNNEFVYNGVPQNQQQMMYNNPNMQQSMQQQGQSQVNNGQQPPTPDVNIPGPGATNNGKDVTVTKSFGV